jgi:hypothetical protein
LALGKYLGRSHDAGTIPKFRACREDVPVSSVSACGAGTLVQQILKLNLATLESCGVRVRQIVRDNIQVHLLGFHPGSAGVQRLNHSV